MHVESPLDWPAGWPRTDRRLRASGARFTEAGVPVTFDGAVYKLKNELRLLHARGSVLTCNQMRFRTDDPGVAIYFTIGKRQMAMACDRYDNQASNCRSLGLAILAMRQLNRHGGGAMMNKAFDGFV